MPEERTTEYMLTGMSNSGWSVLVGPVEMHGADGTDSLYVHYACKVIADKEDGDQIVGECQNGRTPEDAINRALRQAWEKVAILALLSLGQVKVPQ